MENNMIHFTTFREIETSADNFIIPLDESITMVGAYSDSTHELAQVEASKFVWEMTLKSDGSSYSHRMMGLPTMPGGQPWLNVHAIVLTVAWGVLNMFQLITQRYLKHHYEWRQLAHMIAGGAIFCLTLFGYVIAFGISGWVLAFNAPHAIAANPTVWLGFIIIIGGVVAYNMRLGSLTTKYDW